MPNQRRRSFLRLRKVRGGFNLCIPPKRNENTSMAVASNDMLASTQRTPTIPAHDRSALRREEVFEFASPSPRNEPAPRAPEPENLVLLHDASSDVINEAETKYSSPHYSLPFTDARSRLDPAATTASLNSNGDQRAHSLEAAPPLPGAALVRGDAVDEHHANEIGVFARADGTGVPAAGDPMRPALRSVPPVRPAEISPLAAALIIIDAICRRHLPRSPSRHRMPRSTCGF